MRDPFTMGTDDSGDSGETDRLSKGEKLTNGMRGVNEGIRLALSFLPDGILDTVKATR